MDEVTMEGRVDQGPPRRGRRWIGFALLLLVGTAGGATAGWASTEPLYRSQGLVYIAPVVLPPANPADCVLPLWEGYLAYQVELLKSPRVALMAMETEPWKARRHEAYGLAALPAFEARRSIEHAPSTQHVAIGFTHPDHATAQAGVRALIEAYTSLSEDLNDANGSLEYARAQSEKLMSMHKETVAQLLTITQEYGGTEGLELRHGAVVRRLLETEDLLMKVRNLLDAETQPGAVDAPVTPGEIAVEHAAMADMLLQLARFQAEEASVVGKLGAQSERVLELRREIAVYEKRIDEFAAAWNQARRARQSGEATPEELKAREQRLLAHLEQLQAQARKLGQTRADVERLQAHRADLERQLTEMTALKERLTSQLLGKGRIRVADPGSLPTEPWCDGRPSRVLTWGGLGALLGLLGLLGLGFLGHGFLGRGRRRD